MKSRATIILAATLLGSALVACSSTPSTPPPAPPQGPAGEPLVAFLVRHAEKADRSADPELSVEGVQRAAELASTLHSAGIGAIHSSDYLRTRETARPLAEELGLEIELYDPRDLPALADALRSFGGRHLVVGHSNTTPQLAELLGGDPGPAIAEDEYDRLYVITGDGNGEVDTILLRYGGLLRFTAATQ